MSDLLNQASLVMVPSGYKEDTVYSVVPSDGSGDLSFTRASNGTRINSAGLVEDVPWNLLEQSETFTSGTWGANSNTVTANTTTAPNGTTTADTFTLTASVDSSVYQAVNGESNNYTISVYAKYVSGDKYLYFFSPLNSQGEKVWFDIQNGTVSNQLSGFTGTIEDAGNGWYKCSMYNTTAAVLDYLQMGISTTNSSRTLSNNSVSYFWGAQVNLGTAKPYFPTTDRLNVPRLTYQNGGGGCPSLLLEKQSTNLQIYSENSALWTQPADGLTVAYNTTETLDPSGNYGAEKVTSNGGNFRMFEVVSNGIGAITASAFVKAGTGNLFRLFTTSGSIETQFNLTTQTVTSVVGSGTITAMGNGWYRVTASGTATIAFEVIQYVFPNSSSQYMYFWGAQFEDSAYATSYIPTTSSSATRVADECSKTGISSLIGQTEGVLFVDFEFKGYDELSKWIAFLGTGSSYIGLYTDNVFRIVADVANAGTSQFISQTFTFSVGTRYKMAIAYKANDFAFYINGTQIATDSSGTVPTTSQFDFNYNTTANNLTSRIYNQAILFKTRLTNAELASLTTI